MSYLYRDHAARAAKSKSWPGFITFFDRKVSQWYNREVATPFPPELLAWEKTDFVHHVEWTTESYHQDFTGEKLNAGNLHPCLVVTCRREEITEAIPEGYVIQPITRELWYEIKGSAQSPGLRAKSEIESPVKVVWRLADEMKSADRKTVIAACVEAGVNKSTASTQYYKWQLAQKGS